MLENFSVSHFIRQTKSHDKFSKPPIHIDFGESPGLVEDRKMKIGKFCGGETFFSCVKTCRRYAGQFL